MKGGMKAPGFNLYRSDSYENPLPPSSRDSGSDPMRIPNMTEAEFKAEMERRREELAERQRGERQWEKMQKAKRISVKPMDPPPRVSSIQEKRDRPKRAAETYQMDLDAVRRAREAERAAAAAAAAREAERAAAEPEPEPEPVTAPPVSTFVYPDYVLQQDPKEDQAYKKDSKQSPKSSRSSKSSKQSSKSSRSSKSSKKEKGPRRRR